MATSNTRRNTNARDDDLYTTPAWAIQAILNREPMVGTFCDAGYGTGNITKELTRKGLDRKLVTGVDKHLHAIDLDVLCDFLDYNTQHHNVITNPPFKLLIPFMLKAISLSSSKTLVFARINFLESSKRFNEIFCIHKPARIYSFVNCVSCSKGYDMQGCEGAVMYCWVVWDKQYTGPTIFDWIDEHPKDYY